MNLNRRKQVVLALILALVASVVAIFPAAGAHADNGTYAVDRPGNQQMVYDSDGNVDSAFSFCLNVGMEEPTLNDGYTYTKITNPTFDQFKSYTGRTGLTPSQVTDSNTYQQVKRVLYYYLTHDHNALYTWNAAHHLIYKILGQTYHFNDSMYTKGSLQEMIDAADDSSKDAEIERKMVVYLYVSGDTTTAGLQNTIGAELLDTSYLDTTAIAADDYSTDAMAATISQAQLTSGFNLKDSIAYSGLTGGASYTVTGSIHEVSGKTAQAAAVYEKLATFTADASGAGTWTMDFGTLDSANFDLKAGKTYVIYESAVANKNSNSLVEEKDPTAVKQQFTIADRPVVKFYKVDIKGQLIAGARLEVYKNSVSGSPVEKWNTLADVGTQIELDPGNYVVHETVVPNGYRAISDISFTVNADGTVSITNANGNAVSVTNGFQVYITDQPSGKVTFSKVDEDGNNLAGARIEIHQDSASGTKVAQWNTLATDTAVSLSAGTYVFTEVNTPDGYQRVNDITFSVDGSGNVTVVNANGNTVSASGSRLVVTDKKNSEGGQLKTTVSASAGDTATSASESAAASISSAIADAGILVQDTIDYSGLSAGKQYSVTGQLFEVVDGKETGSAVATATKEFTADESGSGSWNLNFDTVQGLKSGSSYVVFETATSADNLVDSDADGTVDAKQVLEHKDATDVSQMLTITPAGNQEFRFFKVSESGATLTGAVFELYSDTGELVRTTNDWYEHAFDVTPGVYRLHEITAPAGYQLIDDFSFYIGTDGSITLDAGTPEGVTVKQTDQYGDVLYIADKASPQITVSKVDESGNHVDGARLNVLKAGTDTVVEQWNTTDPEITFGLNPGDYTLREVTTPAGYETIADTPFTVADDGTVTLGAGASAAVRVEGGNKLIVTDATISSRTGTLQTTVTAAGASASSSAAATVTQAQADAGVAVTDAITYADLAGGQSYTVTGQLFAVTDGVAAAEPVATQTQTFTADASGSGTWAMDFGTVTGLKLGTSYVVYETATSVDNLVDSNSDGTPDAPETIVHNNPADTSQTLTVVENPKHEVQFSKVNLGGEEIPGAVIQLRNSAGQTVQAWTSTAEAKTLTLEAGTYTFHEVNAPAGYQAVTDITFTVDAAGTVTVTNTNGNTAIGAGGKLTVTDLPDASLATTVTAGGAAASDTAPATVTQETPGAAVSVTDSIAYTGLVSGEKYSVTGQLYEVADGATVGDPVATQTQEFVADASGSGTWTLDFGSVSGIRDASSYVVFETATSVNNLIDADSDGTPEAKQIIEHKNPSDTAQTFTVKPELRFTKVKADGSALNGAQFELYSGDSVASGTLALDMKDNTWYEHAFQVDPGQYTLHEAQAPTGYQPVEDFSFTVNADGSITLGANAPQTVTVVNDATNGDILRIVDEDIPAIAISKVNLGGEEIPGAVIQLRNSAGQTVQAWTSTAEAKTLTLEAGTYTFHEVNAPAGYQAVTDITFTVDAAGTVTVTNTNGNTAIGTDGKLTVTDLPDASLRTSVSAGTSSTGTGTSSTAASITAAEANAGVAVSDNIEYSGLVSGEKYSVTGQLYEVADGATVGDPVATQTQEFVADASGSGTWTLNFGSVTGLKSGSTYVVFETATSVNNLIDADSDGTADTQQVIEHKNPADTAQTVTVTPTPTHEVKISKVNIAGTEIAGAQIMIYQDNLQGAKVADWVSVADQTQVISLAPGTYVFHEEAAPTGYLTVTDITFAVDEAGTVTVTNLNGNTVTASANTLTVTDQQQPALTLPFTGGVPSDALVILGLAAVTATACGALYSWRRRVRI